MKQWCRSFYEDGTPLGSGVLLTPEGHLLTAQHVLDEVLTVSIKLPGVDELAMAMVLGADHLADVALLKADIEREMSVPHAMLLPLTSLAAGNFEQSAICVVGYEIRENAGVRRLSPRDERNLFTLGSRGGFLRFQGEVPVGFSGGGAFADGRLLGITQRSSRYGSRILPIQHIWTFISRFGLQVEVNGEVTTALTQTDIASLAVKLENTRRNVEKILTSVRWLADTSILEGNEFNDALVIRYEPMPIQQVVGSISGEATPIFDTPGVKAFVKENKAISFPIYGPLEEQLFSFSGAKHAIDHVISRYADHGIHVDWSNLTGIRLSFKVRADNIESAEPIEILIERGDS